MSTNTQTHKHPTDTPITLPLVGKDTILHMHSMISQLADRHSYRDRGRYKHRWYKLMIYMEQLDNIYQLTEFLVLISTPRLSSRRSDLISPTMAALSNNWVDIFQTRTWVIPFGLEEPRPRTQSQELEFKCLCSTLDYSTYLSLSPSLYQYTM